MKSTNPKVRVAPPIVIASEVARRVRQHARSNMKTEVCGVLIGSTRDETSYVDACIAGRNAAQAGTHVTFTQDTWEHIYKVKDAEYPEARIVGWYHSHPGFGVFLSDHDTFIHRNFFSAPEQIAWVFDPHSDEEGFFGWAGDRIERIGLFSFTDSRGGEEGTDDHGPEPAAAQEEHTDEAAQESRKTQSAPWLRWTATILSHLIAIAIGLLIAWYIFPRVIMVPVPVDPKTGEPLLQLPEARPSSSQQAPATQAPPAAANPSKTNPSDKTNAASEGKSAQPR
jgi:proteasome lid subunit RPN8/RPN11